MLLLQDKRLHGCIKTAQVPVNSHHTVWVSDVDGKAIAVWRNSYSRHIAICSSVNGQPGFSIRANVITGMIVIGADVAKIGRKSNRNLNRPLERLRMYLG